MDFGSKQISIEKVEVPFHEHPLISFIRFDLSRCEVCISSYFDYIYGGYRCNELGCERFVFHNECVNPLPEINHSSHPDHSLKLTQDLKKSYCSLCGKNFKIGYCCSVCEFKLDMRCARIPQTYKAYDHTCQPQHQLKALRGEIPDYADKKCLFCEKDFDEYINQHQHCDVCNFSICRVCMKNPPPVVVESKTTHEHKLHLIPRCIKFTCNACGELGHRSPYFCLQCNIMIHRQCIDLPRVININRHDHRISYIRRLGHGVWNCRICRKKVDGFYGGYTCVKCPTFVVHSQCATNKNVWDMRELEWIPEEEVIPPFVVIDDNTIKHCSHDHNLRINKDGRIQPENVVCEACVLQILSEPFYSCEECNFILHEKCANHPRKKRHVLNNQPLILQTDSRHKMDRCTFCYQDFSGFRYKNPNITLDVRCAAISDTLEHGSHQHPLYYIFALEDMSCSRCHQHPNWEASFFKCDDCEYSLHGKCVIFPTVVMKKRYDDHPLLLCFGDMDVKGEYWCEACETKVNPKEWFYTCNDCNTILHISCVVGDFTYILPGLVDKDNSLIVTKSVRSWSREMASNTSINRPLCSGCDSRCILPTILKLSKAGVEVYLCSLKCDILMNDKVSLN